MPVASSMGSSRVTNDHRLGATGLYEDPPFKAGIAE
jgi:hypothetical protein